MTEPYSLAYSNNMSPARRLVRFLMSSINPLAYLHLLRMANFYNHTHVAPRRKMIVGRDCAISPDVNFMHGERITLGDRVSLASRCFIWAGPARGSVVLEDDVLLGPEVLITAASYRYNDGSPVAQQPMEEGDIRIGRDVWIGCRATILPGVTLGAGCIVGAGSIVTRSFPAGSVLVGAPARVVRHRTIAPFEHISVAPVATCAA